MFKYMFDKEFLLVPFAKSNINQASGSGYIGYSIYYIFGIRIFQIQQTKPWN